MKKKLKKFLTTPIGSLLKTFVLVMLAFLVEAIYNKTFVFPPDANFIWAMFYSGIAAVANTLHNWLNSEYKQFGIGSEKK